MYPQTALVEEDTMLTVLPLGVPVPKLFKPPGSKPGSDGKFTEPPLDWNMDSVRSGISNYETYGCFCGTAAAQRHPYLGEIGKVRSDHHIVLFLPPMRFPLPTQIAADRFYLRSDGLKNWS